MILKIRNEKGEFIDVPAIKGDAFKYEDFTPEQLEGLKPKKGTDYFTDEDIKEMVAEVGKSDNYMTKTEGGNLEDLQTKTKENLVAAINEVKASIGKVDINTEQNAKEVQLTIDEETNTISAKIVDNAITADKIAEGAVSADKIGVAAITEEKLAESIKQSIEKAAQAISSIEPGETNGTIKVDGMEVKIAGLDTAAYKAETDFDPAGSADEAKKYADELMTWNGIPITKELTDKIINETLIGINEAMNEYAKVTLEADKVKVNISNGDIMVTRVYTDMFQKLLQALKDNANKYTKVTGEDGAEINITPGSVDAMEVVKFVKAVLPGVSGQTKLQDIYGQEFTATFHTVDNNDYTYIVSFESGI